MAEPKRLLESETPSRMVPCRRCGAKTELTGAAYDIAKNFSRHLLKRGESTLKADELIECDPCGRLSRDDYARELLETSKAAHAILRDVRAGKPVMPTDEQWLRDHGYGANLARAREVAREAEGD